MSMACSTVWDSYDPFRSKLYKKFGYRNICHHFKNDFDIFDVTMFFCAMFFDKDLDKLDAYTSMWEECYAIIFGKEWLLFCHLSYVTSDVF